MPEAMDAVDAYQLPPAVENLIESMLPANRNLGISTADTMHHNYKAILKAIHQEFAGKVAALEAEIEALKGGKEPAENTKIEAETPPPHA